MPGRISAYPVNVTQLSICSPINSQLTQTLTADAADEFYIDLQRTLDNMLSMILFSRGVTSTHASLNNNIHSYPASLNPMMWITSMRTKSISRIFTRSRAQKSYYHKHLLQAQASPSHQLDAFRQQNVAYVGLYTCQPQLSIR
jgi:hypothetical protein